MGIALTDVAKTGLGSSTALIMFLVTALLLQAEPIDLMSLQVHLHDVWHTTSHNSCTALLRVKRALALMCLQQRLDYTQFSPAMLQLLMDDSARVPPLIPLLYPDGAGLLIFFHLFLLQPGLQSLLSVLAVPVMQEIEEGAQKEVRSH